MWLSVQTFRNDQPADYGWIIYAGFAVAPLVWLGLRFKCVRDHAESIPVLLAVFVVLTGAMLDLGENVNNIGIPMLTGLIGVGLGSWFAHRAVVVGRLERERALNQEARVATQALRTEIADVKDMLRDFSAAWSSERVVRREVRDERERAWVDLATSRTRSCGVTSVVIAQRADAAAARERALVRRVHARGRVRVAAGHRSRHHAVRRSRADWLRAHPLFPE